MTQRSGELQRTLAIYTSLFKIESSVKSMLWAGLDNDQALYAAAKKTSLDEFAVASREVDALDRGADARRATSSRPRRCGRSSTSGRRCTRRSSS